MRDPDFGAVRLRAFGNYAYRVSDPRLLHTEISGTREAYTVADLDGQLRGLVLQNTSQAIASSGIAFLDLAANQRVFAQALSAQLAPEFEKIGLKLEGMTVQNVSLPEELQKVLDQKIGMGMVGNDMGKFMQYQTAQAIPKMVEGGGGDSGVAGDAMGLGAGVALGQVLGQVLADLSVPHPDLREQLLRVDITRYGHAMACPIPGPQVVWPTAAGRLHFAHADGSGYSVFEEAFTRGHLAGTWRAPRRRG